MQPQVNRWHTMTAEEVEKRQKTNRKSGLTPKIAQARAERFGRNELFLPEARSVKTCIKRILSDPSLLLLAFLCLIALCFARFQSALTILFVLFISCSVSIVAYVKTNRVKEAMSAYSAPRVRVIRGGQLLLCDASCLVPGDVLILCQGDVVACDARLIATRANFSVLTYQSDAKGKVEYQLHPKNAAVLYEREDTTPVLERENMIYAGSIVHEGEARAIVTAIGDQTYLASLCGSHPLAMQVGDPAYMSPMRKYMNRYSIILCALILPIVILGCVIGRGRVDLLEVVLLALALVVSAMGEQLMSMGRIVCACAIVRASFGTEKNNTAMIKNYRALDPLSRVEDVFLFGKTALSDGHLHPYAAYVADGLLIGHNMKGAALAQLYESVYRYERCAAEHGIIVTSRAHAEEWACGVEELGDLLQFDREAADIRTIKLQPLEVANEWVEVTMRGQKEDAERHFRIHRCTEPEPLLRCNAANRAGKAVPLDEPERRALFKMFIHLKNQGTDVCAYVREERGYVIFEGILAFREAFDPELRETKRRLESDHVRVSLFLPEEGNCYLNELLATGWIEDEEEVVYASSLTKNGQTLAELFESKRVFFGFSETDIREQISRCRAQGRLTAALGLTHHDAPLMNPADVCFSCEPRTYHTDMHQKVQIEAVSLHSVDECDQSIRRSADVLIRRAGPTGGGIAGIVHAVETARSISFSMMLTMQYLLVAQLLRVTLVLLPLLFGWQPHAPALLLISGLWVDLAYILICAFHHCGAEVLRNTPDYVRFFKAPLRSRPDWVCAAIICGAFTVLAGWVLRGTGVAPDTNGAALYMFLALLASQSCLLLCLLRTAGIFQKRWRAYASSLLVLVSLLVLLLPILLIAPISRWFSATGGSVALVIVALLSPLYLLGSYFISLTYRHKFVRGISYYFRKISSYFRNKRPPHA